MDLTCHCRAFRLPTFMGTNYGVIGTFDGNYRVSERGRPTVRADESAQAFCRDQKKDLQIIRKTEKPGDPRRDFSLVTKEEALMSMWKDMITPRSPPETEIFFTCKARE